MDRRTERQQELDATRGNRRVAAHSLAMKLLRQNSSLTMLDAVEQARAILKREGRW